MSKHIVQHRRGTTSEWATVGRDIIPEKGEIVIELDDTTVEPKHKLKIGDGEHKYSELAYLMAGDEIITQVLTKVQPRVVTITLVGKWTQADNGKYRQKISLNNITKYSRLDLKPSADMITEFRQLGIVFVTENHNGEIFVYSVGNQPTKEYTMQASIVETECDDPDQPVIGTPVSTSVTQSDWHQTDTTKSDYIKNKPVLGSLSHKDIVEKTDLNSDVQTQLDKIDYGWELLISNVVTSGLTAETTSIVYNIIDGKEYDAVAVLMYVPSIDYDGNLEIKIGSKSVGKVADAITEGTSHLIRIDAEKSYAWRSDFTLSKTTAEYSSTIFNSVASSADQKTIKTWYRNFVTNNANSSISIASNQNFPIGTVVRMMGRRVK